MAEKCVSGTLGLLVAEMCVSSTIGLMMAERCVSGTIELMMVERCVSGTIGLLVVEMCFSGAIGLMVAERCVSGTIELMMAERCVSSTIELLVAEMCISSAIGLMVAKRCISGMIELLVAEMCVSGAIGLMVAERCVSRTIELMMAEMCLSGAIGLMVAKRCISGTIELMMAERCISGTIGLMIIKGVHREHTSVVEDFSKSDGAQLVALSHCVLRRWGAGIVPSRTLFFTCFRLCKSRGGYYLMARAGFKISSVPTNNKGWKDQYFFVSGPSWGFRANWSIHPISNVPPLLFEEESIVVNRLRGILPLSQVIRNMTEKWLVEVGLNPASWGAMDLNVLRKKPKMPGGKSAPAARPESAQPEVEVIHTEASAKRLVESPVADQATSGRPSKQIKIMVRKHKSHRNEGSSRPAAREREPEVSVDDSSPTYRRPKSMRDLCGMRVREDNEGYYVLQMTDWAPKDSTAKQIVMGHHYQMALLDRVHDSGRLVTHMGNRASLLELEADNAKLRSGVDKLTDRLEEADKELNKLREGLAESQRQLKEQKVDHRKADDVLLKLMRENKSLKAKLSGISVANYKQSIRFGWGLRWMGQVSYEYGYQVALAHFQAQYPDLEVDSDPFTERPEDNSVPMKIRQEFDDSMNDREFCNF
ncbi:hypothetical protein B296_00051802 [Ensete ventricosum]|uniref:Uncharacterized protein n=1 Tax=Ensete ventricosum TaxID=4639 RepID=A0A426Y3Q8_ENSVE|nr:hypothetical protein B296_00051802 [Ensete ventricosum]